MPIMQGHYPVILKFNKILLKYVPQFIKGLLSRSNAKSMRKIFDTNSCKIMKSFLFPKNSISALQILEPKISLQKLFSINLLASEGGWPQLSLWIQVHVKQKPTEVTKNSKNLSELGTKCGSIYLTE